jgi:hypothetical protein
VIPEKFSVSRGNGFFVCDCPFCGDSLVVFGDGWAIAHSIPSCDEVWVAFKWAKKQNTRKDKKNG